MTRIDAQAARAEAAALLAAVELNQHMLISEARAVLGWDAANRLEHGRVAYIVGEFGLAWRDSEPPMDLLPIQSEGVP